LNVPLLSISWLLPVAGAVLLLFVGNADGRRNGLIRWLTLAVSIAGFAVTLAIWASFDAASPGSSS
jgi:NADH:ubiquinone oxidoreductase subunit 4 (subunit M)